MWNIDPDLECQLCPRLVEYRHESRRSQSEDWFNSPVPTFKAEEKVKLLIVGLAPGLKGANRTGRAFTGDVAGDLLYPDITKLRIFIRQIRCVILMMV